MIRDYSSTSMLNLLTNISPPSWRGSKPLMSRSPPCPSLFVKGETMVKIKIKGQGGLESQEIIKLVGTMLSRLIYRIFQTRLLVTLPMQLNLSKANSGCPIKATKKVKKSAMIVPRPFLSQIMVFQSNHLRIKYHAWKDKYCNRHSKWI